MTGSTRDWKFLLCAASLCALTACGDDEEDQGTGTLDAGATSGLLDASTPAPTTTGDGGVVSQPAPADGARYAVVTQVSASGDQATSYVSVTRSLSSATPVSLEGSTQVLGRALAANEVGSGTVFVSTGGPELTKYVLDAQDKLQPAGKVSFQQFGVGTIGEYASQLQFVSSTKAYYFDTRTAQIIVWNPTDLTPTRAIDLKDLRLPDATLTFSSTLPVKRAAKIVLAAGWRSTNNQRVIKQAAVVVLDTATDTATVLKDERCGYVRDAVEAADGRVYLATEAWGSSVHRLNPEFAPAPCLLRLDAALSAFDPAYSKELNAIGGGVTGSLTQSRDGKVYTRVLDEAAAKIGPMTSARALASLPVWSWAEVTLGDTPTATKVPGAPLGTGSLIVLDTRDQRFVAEIKQAGTDLIDLTRGVGGVSISTPGLTFSAAQLR